ncbi:transglutaminase family protein [Luteococcus peritonei]|uniref:DUF2126 domain-containing protein n=1 Tax=Luteococcus peritonei TaxID=88874 RepID=A0ABW4RXG4_9ACTN
MTIRVALHHATTYRFDQPVKIYPHTVRLRPAPHTRTPISAYKLTVTPQNHFLNWQQDPFGNYMARLVFPEPAEELSITVDLVADMTVINPFDFFLEDWAEHFPFSYPDELAHDLSPYLHQVGADDRDDNPTGAGHSAGDAVDEFIARTITPQGLTDGSTRTVDFLWALNQAVRQEVAYTVRMEPGVQSPGETLANRLGSCRDSAWLLVSVLRRFGLAARFVSGYLVQLTADEKPLDGPAGPSEDFTDLHAWAEVYVPGAGWIGLDATSGLFCGEGHIPLSATPHPSSAAAITGATGIAQVDFSFANTVTRIHEDPRVTLPYTEQQWAEADAMGEFVDRRLAAGDVRLTMGGEPTFVSAGDTSSPQWETAADGEEKRQLATRLADRLRERWARGGITQHGQGKWYPGEPLPRWQIELAWRRDGQPLWRDQSLLDDPWAPPSLPEDPAERAEASRRLAEAVAKQLGIPADLVVAAHEDPAEAVLAEARQPWGEPPTLDVDPADPALADEAGRASLAARLDAGAGLPRGHVIPLYVDEDSGGWATTRWRTRRGHLFLIGGTSPLGLRLPLDSVAWSPTPDITRNHDGDSSRGLQVDLPEGVVPAVVGDVESAPRTALDVEERDGHLFCFLPPLDRLDDAVRLVAAVEAACAETGLHVVLEGYPLPSDDRLEKMSVTPDPGVVEVNVAPTTSWAALREQTVELYEDARASGLGTEKFDLDGTHTGTGGGNHVTLGGASVADSPLLRRPDLLRSLLTFWQHHPALSYVFNGKFIGPTSQSPRVDEGRHENLYELEIAFDELAAMVADPEVEHDLARVVADDWRFDEDPEERIERQRRTQPWLTDRLLRHLLTDITGNTHRSEFCIDKLYSPDSRTGRLGILEMRGFEMPPHARMAMVQKLLVRALVARFWEQPYAAPLVRWGTRLHDRFLLPAFASADLRDVVEQINAHFADAPDAVRFKEAWFRPFLEFRFPRLGEVHLGGIHLELRQAIEPWQVLGEEVHLGGTSRYVDSSVERVQVSAVGLVEGRHVVTCNGVPVPMVPMPTSGWGLAGNDFPDGRVGGVRYRAWAPPSALHPTIGVHSPLQFDVVDTWNQTSLGGFTYHVVHPGGRSYDTYPVNAAEAESRRSNRFVASTTTGRVDTSAWPSVMNPVVGDPSEYAVTLDLRRFSRGQR